MVGFVMAGGFYKDRYIYVPSSFISVLLKDKILALEILDDFIGFEMGKIVSCYILLLVSFSVYWY